MSIQDTTTETIKPLKLDEHTPFIGENINIQYPLSRKNKTQKWLNSPKFNQKLTTTVYNDDLYQMQTVQFVRKLFKPRADILDFVPNTDTATYFDEVFENMKKDPDFFDRPKERSNKKPTKYLTSQQFNSNLTSTVFMDDIYEMQSVEFIRNLFKPKPKPTDDLAILNLGSESDSRRVPRGLFGKV